MTQTNSKNLITTAVRHLIATSCQYTSRLFVIYIFFFVFFVIVLVKHFITITTAVRHLIATSCQYTSRLFVIYIFFFVFFVIVLVKHFITTYAYHKLNTPKPLLLYTPAFVLHGTVTHNSLFSFCCCLLLVQAYIYTAYLPNHYRTFFRHYGRHTG